VRFERPQYLAPIIAEITRLNVAPRDHNEINRLHELHARFSEYVTNSSLNSVSHNRSLLELCRDSDRKPALGCQRIQYQQQKVLGVNFGALLLAPLNVFFVS